MADSTPLPRPRVVQPGQRVVDPDARELQAQVLAGDGLERVRLVDHGDLVLGQQAEAVAPQRQVGDEQRVVDHQHVGRPHPPPGLEEEAVGVSAGTRGPGSCRPRSARPPRRWASGGSPGRTGCRRSVRFDHIRSVTSWSISSGRWNRQVLPLDRHVEPPQADVVRPPLDQDRRELLRHHRAQERDVLVEQLLLERDGVRRDDDLRLRVGGGLDRRAPGRRSSCRRPCPPRRSGARAARWRGPPPGPSRAAPRDARSWAAAARSRRRVRGSRRGPVSPCSSSTIRRRSKDRGSSPVGWSTQAIQVQLRLVLGGRQRRDERDPTPLAVGQVRRGIAEDLIGSGPRRRSDRVSKSGETTIRRSVHSQSEVIDAEAAPQEMLDLRERSGEHSHDPLSARVSPESSSSSSGPIGPYSVGVNGAMSSTWRCSRRVNFTDGSRKARRSAFGGRALARPRSRARPRNR